MNKKYFESINSQNISSQWLTTKALYKTYCKAIYYIYYNKLNQQTLEIVNQKPNCNKIKIVGIFKVLIF